MSVSGTITSCDRLVAEGTVDAKLDGCQHVVVAQTGVFRGTVSTDHADVHGRFEGELVVKKRLLVRAAGQVSGTVSYGEIEIECGGRISGQVQRFDSVPGRGKQPDARDRREDDQRGLIIPAAPEGAVAVAPSERLAG